MFSILLAAALMHVSTSISSKEEVPLHIPKVHPVLNAFLDEFDMLAKDLFDRSKSPGAAIAIVHHGRIIYGEGLGIKKVNSTDSIDIHTTFRIGSVSKTFAGVMAGKLVNDGELGWHDKVKKYLPYFELKTPAYADSMEIRHVLSQSTGLIQHAYTNFIEDGDSLDEMIRDLSDVKSITAPGNLYSYQNVAYGIIEPVVKAATGIDYNSLVINRIFKPLGMRDASMDYESMVSGGDYALPNFPRRGGWSAGKISKTYYNVSAAGGINASITDMAKYMIALTGHRHDVVSQQVLDDIFTPQIRTRIHWKYFSRWRDYKKSYYGLGWRIVDNNDSRIAYHGGYVNGFRSQLAINTDEDLGICVLTNSPSSFSSKLVPAFLKLYDQYKERIREEENRSKSIVLLRSATLNNML